jgi:hypothetical protein
MDRLVAPNSVPFAGADVAPTGGTPQYATSGNPGTGQAATLIEAYAWNAVQDEIVNAEIDAGLTQAGPTWNQLSQSILIRAGGYALDTGTVNAVAITLKPNASLPAGTAWPASAAVLMGAQIRFKIGVTNTGPATITINAAPPIPIVRPGGVPLSNGDMPVGVTLAGTITTATIAGVVVTVLQLLDWVTPGTYAADIGPGAPPTPVVNALFALVSPPMAAYPPGAPLRIVPALTNTGASTIAISGLPPIPIRRSDGTPVAAGDLPGTIAQMAMINAAGSSVQLLAPSPSQYAASAPAPFGGALNPIAGAAHMYVAGDATKATQRSNAGAAMIDLLPGATAGALPAGWSGTIINTDATALLAVQVGAGSTMRGPSASNGTLIIGPGQMAIVACDGVNYQSWGWTGRAKLTANTTIFVSTTGSDTSNTGITAGSAFATGSHAYSWAQNFLDLSEFTLTISFAAGTFTAGVVCAGIIVGQNSNVILNGAGTASTTISTSASAAVSVVNGAMVMPQNMSLTASGAGSACIAAGGSGSGGMSTIFVGPGLSFGAAALAHMVVAQGGIIMLSSSYTITAGASAHWFAQNGGAINNGNTGIIVTLTGTPAFSVAFAVCSSSLVNPSNAVTFVGSATGAKYSIIYGGNINTAGSGVSYLPGSLAGSGTGYN